MSFSVGIDTITQNMIASIVQSMQVTRTVIPEPQPKPSLELYSGRGRRGRPSHYLEGKKWCKGCEKSFESLTSKCPECRRSARSVPHNKKFYRNQRKVFEGY